MSGGVPECIELCVAAVQAISYPLSLEKSTQQQNIPGT